MMLKQDLALQILNYRDYCLQKKIRQISTYLKSNNDAAKKEKNTKKVP